MHLNAFLLNMLKTLSILSLLKWEVQIIPSSCWQVKQLKTPKCVLMVEMTLGSSSSGFKVVLGNVTGNQIFDEVFLY